MEEIEKMQDLIEEYFNYEYLFSSLAKYVGFNLLEDFYKDFIRLHDLEELEEEPEE